MLTVKTDWPHARAAVISLLLIFFARGLFYCLVMPLWEGFDEPYQFAAVQHVALTGHMPSPTTPTSREVAASLYLSPAPWMLRLHDLPKPVITYEQYWKLAQQEREKLRGGLLSLPNDWTREASDPPIANYEGQQAPLYYFIAAPILRATSGLTLPGQVFVLRLFSLLLACATLPLGYALAERALRDKRLALLATVLVVAMPEFLIDICRVSNEPLALLLCTALLLVAVRFIDSGQPVYYIPGIALLTGLALLTKAYFLAFLPALVFLLWLRLRPPREAIRLVTTIGVAAAIVALVAGPWYWHIHKVSGSWSGQGDDAAVGKLSRMALLSQVAHVNWRSGFASILFSHVWFGGWSFLRFPTWIYLCVLLPAAAAVTGVCIYAWKWLKSGRPADSVVAIAALYVCFWLGLCYHVLVTYVHSGVSASTGWYLYCLVFGEAVLLIVGARQLFGQRALRWLLPIGTALLLAIDLYGLHAFMLPYYAGITEHVGERVPPLSIGAFSASSIFGKLATLGPAWFNPGLLILSWAAYLLAAICLVLLAMYLGRRLETREQL
jgi:hypothetical protein